MKVTVIGAGILGASTAYHLAIAGHDVTVVDQEHQGKATLAGAGIVCPWATKLDEPEWYRMYAAGARYYEELVVGLAERGQSDVGYRKVGALVTAEDPADYDAAGERLARRTAEAPESGGFEEISPEQAQVHFPPINPAFKAFYVPGGARVNARQLAPAMLRAAVALGATFLSDLATLELDGARARVLDGRGEEIPSDKIVVTAGAWASQILGPLGLHHPVKPQRGQILHFGMKGADTSRWSVLLPMASHYLLAFDDSRVVVGATREDGKGFDYRVTCEGQHEVLSAALRYAPGLADATLLETRIGFRPAPPGFRPILGPVPGIDGLILGNGLGAAGLTIGPYAGRQLARIVAGETPEVSLDPYSPAA
ncbi:FAD-binding oxidoreductase [Salipiger sp. P9]|uniref:NAD(P)/FAD-dependent oxidoreductase n=1 Tax=Salipiger pentaromativorans TaxID=2943193 RepID=UPI00215835F5|nr:FAD-dependent oxidoreductase [Salipiger pentaromativorans]MCR8549163.1 FAD-binding oxidoreductase [Salipiger pentaromativorans]